MTDQIGLASLLDMSLNPKVHVRLEGRVATLFLDGEGRAEPIQDFETPAPGIPYTTSIQEVRLVVPQDKLVLHQAPPQPPPPEDGTVSNVLAPDGTPIPRTVLDRVAPVSQATCPAKVPEASPQPTQALSEAFREWVELADKAEVQAVGSFLKTFFPETDLRAMPKPKRKRVKYDVQEG